MVSSRGTTRIAFSGARVFIPPPSGKKPKEVHDGASTTFGSLYANDIAREMMEADKPSTFPVGSILVREKLRRPTDQQPRLLTVMVKRASGFNPKGNDWEFLLIDGTMKKIKHRQKTGSCLNCHTSMSHRDFVFPAPLEK